MELGELGELGDRIVVRAAAPRLPSQACCICWACSIACSIRSFIPGIFETSNPAPPPDSIPCSFRVLRMSACRPMRLFASNGFCGPSSSAMAKF
jgi:hypothetical protein